MRARCPRSQSMRARCPRSFVPTLSRTRILDEGFWIIWINLIIQHSTFNIQNHPECLCHSRLEFFGEGVEGLEEDGGTVEVVEFFRGVYGLDGFDESFGNSIKAKFEGFEDGGLLGFDESFLAAFLAAFLAELLCDGHGFLS